MLAHPALPFHERRHAPLNVVKVLDVHGGSISMTVVAGKPDRHFQMRRLP